MSDPAIVHAQDQIAACIRDLADSCDVDLTDPRIKNVVQVVTNSLLGAGMGVEPDDRAVANTYYVTCKAWQELVA